MKELSHELVIDLPPKPEFRNPGLQQILSESRGSLGQTLKSLVLNPEAIL